VDAVAAVFPFGSPGFVRLREQFWLEVFAEAAKGTSLIFTFAPEDTVARDFPQRVKALVEAAGGKVDFIRLTAPESVQDQRINAASRSAFGKLTSLELLRQLRPQFIAAMRSRAPDAPRPSGLPQRIVVFGISSLPLQSVQALAELGRCCQVLMFVLNPCQHYWGHIVAERALLKRLPQYRQRHRAGTAIDQLPVDLSQLHSETHDLLANVIGELNAQLVSITITDLADHTFFATLDVRKSDGTLLHIDSRPSDAIALGVAGNVPIFVAEHVLESAVRDEPQ
jgi:hypothetical protein